VVALTKQQGFCVGTQVIILCMSISNLGPVCLLKNNASDALDRAGLGVHIEYLSPNTVNAYEKVPCFKSNLQQCLS
jgi:hypothetical protein